LKSEKIVSISSFFDKNGKLLIERKEDEPALLFVVIFKEGYVKPVLL